MPTPRHLISTTQLTREWLDSELFPLSERLRSGESDVSLAGRSLYCLFYEPSFLTRTSFERAIGMLGGSAYHTEDASQFFPVKTPSYVDNIITLLASLHIDLAILRSSEEGVIDTAVTTDSLPIVNGGSLDDVCGWLRELCGMFAFVLYDMLEKAGLSTDVCELAPVGATPKRWESVKSGEHAGTLTIEPFTSIAIANGFNVLQTSLETVPSYQGGVFAAGRAWAVEYPDSVDAFIRGYLAGLDWTLTPDNYEAAKEILLANMPAIKPGVADAVVTKLLNPATGLTPGGEVDTAGIEMVLSLRSRYATPPKRLSDPAPYLDLSYLQRAKEVDL